MLRPRIIPCLLVKEKGLVKTVKFNSPKYVGDPINAVKIFNEKEVDEIVVLDIDASRKGAPPDYTMIKNIATECRMPLCYGGGVASVEQAVQIIRLGVEKVALSAAAVDRPQLVSDLAVAIGSQSVVVVLDVKRNPRSGELELWTHNGTRKVARNVVDFAKELEQRGVGEITLNAIDRDGVMEGYDMELVKIVREAVSVPMTVLGGAGTLKDLEALIHTFGIIGAAAGSLFVFKGVYRAVLINYPSRAQKEAIYRNALSQVRA